jgi:hypothetical protein
MADLYLKTEAGNNIQFSCIDAENEIEVFMERDDAYSWLSVEQAKQVIEFLTEQIKHHEK